ncbi:MAG: OB-fold domain-containing protein [Leptospiraceae bacterium]|nr:OB-fold domain-containing protein [Leptospiraceae bacterium]
MESQELNCKKCNSCGFLTLSAHYKCPQCSQNNWIDIKLKGEGIIYSYSKINVGFGRMSTKTPYYLAMIQLDEGLNLLAYIDFSFNKKIQINSKVKFHTRSEDNYPIFNVLE